MGRWIKNIKTYLLISGLSPKLKRRWCQHLLIYRHLIQSSLRHCIIYVAQLAQRRAAVAIAIIVTILVDWILAKVVATIITFVLITKTIKNQKRASPRKMKMVTNQYWQMKHRRRAFLNKTFKTLLKYISKFLFTLHMVLSLSAMRYFTRI